MATTEKTKTTLRARVTFAAAVVVVGLAGAARAQVAPDPVDLKVVDRETGQMLPIWRHHGRWFVAGQPGARYGLRVTNHTDGRVLVVMSVDGVNILTGETAGWDQRGYIFGPHESYDVNGWRKSDTEVAAFTFAPLPQSYAVRTGRPADVGVIGVAVFNEKAWLPPSEPRASASPRREYLGLGGAYAQRNRQPPVAATTGMLGGSAAPAPPSESAGVLAGRSEPPAPAAEVGNQMAKAAEPAPLDEKLGTAHGAREWSVVYVEPFERATPYPQFSREIEYDTEARLVAAGVIRPYTEGERHPRPFPSNREGGPYVPDPPDEP